MKKLKEKRNKRKLKEQLKNVKMLKKELKINQLNP